MEIVWSLFSTKVLGLHFGNSVLHNSNWDKVSHSLEKKQYLEQIPSLFEVKKLIVNQIQTLVYRSNIHHSKIIKKESEKTIAQLSI